MHCMIETNVENYVSYRPFYSILLKIELFVSNDEYNFWFSTKKISQNRTRVAFEEEHFDQAQLSDTNKNNFQRENIQSTE